MHSEENNLNLILILTLQNIFILELANRKILEELQLKKQILLKQGSTPSITSSSVSLSSTPATIQLPVSSIPAISSSMVWKSLSFIKYSVENAHPQYTR